MSEALDPLLRKLERDGRLPNGELDQAFAIVMDGKAEPAQVKSFLLATIALMADPQALAAGARALRARMVCVAAPAGAIDVCGTGGDGAHTLNISTAVTFVVAGAGVCVAKHGNRAMSSKSGAADVLEALGVKLTSDANTLEKCLREANVAFLSAQNHHPAMRHVAPARREVGHRTIFNLLGPLANPAGVQRQLVGVFARELVAPMAEALRLLGSDVACVVHGAGGVDELSLHRTGANSFAMMHHSAAKIDVLDFNLKPLDPPRADIEEMRGGDAQTNARALLSLLDGDGALTGYRNVVLLNAALALVVAGRAEHWTEGWRLASHALDSGAARRALRTLVEITKAAP